MLQLILKCYCIAVDLAVVMALASSCRDVSMPPQLACFGEVGLAGELRPAAQTEKRLQAAAALGMKRCLVARPLREHRMELPKTLHVQHVDTLKQALQLIESET
jgi:DNA repair protein RadA/Sms